MDLTRFHPGELEAQRRAGVRDLAGRLGDMIGDAIVPGARRFLSLATAIAIAGVDGDGRCWATLRQGPPGFIQATPTRVCVLGGLRGGDPLAKLEPGSRVGMVGIEMAYRVRYRMNGRVAVWHPDQLAVDVEQAYGNCPRHIDPSRHIPHEAPGEWQARGELDDGDLAAVSSATTFFIGSSHLERGADCSHRGGPAGFLRADGRRRLVFPDYSGNSMFNTLGNLLVSPSAGIVIPQDDGRHLQLTGRAAVDFEAPAGETGRAVSIDIEEVRRG